MPFDLGLQAQRVGMRGRHSTVEGLLSAIKFIEPSQFVKAFERNILELLVPLRKGEVA